MQKRIMITCILAVLSVTAYSQQLPPNECGIVNVYDNAGNRTKRTYFCNNGIDSYPARMNTDETKTSAVYQQVDALYPNPTTGKFFVTFSKTMNKATVYIMDVTGKAVSRFTASGNTIDFDLSSSPAGIYFIRIDDEGKSLVKKVVKQ